MASTSTPALQVSVIDAARDAIEHARLSLFPIRVEKWLVLGFLAFLDRCGRSLNGGGPGGGGDGHGPDWPDGGVLALVMIAGLIAIVLWINARGTFMCLDNVTSNRADITRPWREHARAAQSYLVGGSA
jgi:hypothetical protein